MNPTTVLPVSLLSFTATAQNNLVLLNWATTYELNNKSFEVERSTDSRNWIKLGTVLSKQNNSLELVNYSFTDNLPENGYNYYRLKQIDINGAFTHTEIKTVYFKQKDRAEITIYPNPAKDNIMISGLELNSQINVQNNLGTTILTTLADTEVKRINIANLPAGMYYIVLFNSKGKKTIKKIIKE